MWLKLLKNSKKCYAFGDVNASNGSMAYASPLNTYNIVNLTSKLNKTRFSLYKDSVKQAEILM